MAGAGAAAQFPLQAGRHPDGGGGLRATGIDGGDGGGEQGLGAGSGRQGRIAVQIAGVALEILPRAELQRIDEHADQYAGPGALQRFGGPADQLLVPRMQGAHRGHEMEARSRVLAPPGMQVGGGAQQQHETKTAQPPI